MGSQDSVGIAFCVLLGLLVIQRTICVPVVATRFVDFDLAKKFGDVERSLVDPMMTPSQALGLSENSGKLANPLDTIDFSTASSDSTASSESSDPAHTRPRRAPCRGWGQSPPIPLPCR